MKQDKLGSGNKLEQAQLEPCSRVLEVVNVNFFEIEELKNQKISEDIYIDSIMVEHGALKPTYGYIVKQIGLN